MTALERLLAKVTKADDCWLWTAAVSSNGYGSFFLDGRLTTAHRAAYELLVGHVPDGLQLDHLCRVRACVNPDHLEPVSQRENILRGTSEPAVNVVKTHCKRGHPLSGPNLRMRGTRRQCRACEPLYACNTKAQTVAS